MLDLLQLLSKAAAEDSLQEVREYPVFTAKFMLTVMDTKEAREVSHDVMMSVHLLLLVIRQIKISSLVKYCYQI